MCEKITIVKVAEQLKTTPLNVLMHVKRGLLKGTEEDGLWMIDKASLDTLLARTGGGKAADVCSGGCTRKHACGGGCW